jgi:hypothetical protein
MSDPATKTNWGRPKTAATSAQAALIWYRHQASYSLKTVHHASIGLLSVAKGA